MGSGEALPRSSPPLSSNILFSSGVVAVRPVGYYTVEARKLEHGRSPNKEGSQHKSSSIPLPTFCNLLWIYKSAISFTSWCLVENKGMDPYRSHVIRMMVPMTHPQSLLSPRESNFRTPSSLPSAAPAAASGFRLIVQSSSSPVTLGLQIAQSRSHS